jgi:hypothetical protein
LGELEDALKGLAWIVTGTNRGNLFSGFRALVT